jgi:phosphatidylserine decarboxylase
MNWIKKSAFALFAVIALFLLYYKFWFLRFPERNIPNDNSVFVSPANGKIVAIAPWNSETLVVTKEKFGAINVWTKDVDTAGTIVSIQMNVTNVHFQRAPLASKLLSERHVSGSFNNAVLMSNEYGIRFGNEHNELLFEATDGKRFKLVQVAGFVARRIVDYVSPNQELKQGELVGLIKLGSQVTVLLPHGVKVNANVGDVVTEGETVLANW